MASDVITDNDSRTGGSDHTLTGRSDEERERRTYLGYPLLGAVFLLLCVVLLGLLIYMVAFVVAPMTRPSPVFEHVAKSLEQKAAQPNVDQLTVDLLILLEYANADIRTIGVQVAFALVGGMVLIAVGVLLFAAGATGAFRARAERGPLSFDLTTAAPGLVSLVAGAGIVGLGITKDPVRPLEAHVQRALGLETHTEQRQVDTNAGGPPPNIDPGKVRPREGAQGDGGGQKSTP